MTSSAYLLVAHGSRHSNYQKSLQKLAMLVWQQIRERQTISLRNDNHPTVSPLVKTACLELSEFPLSDYICEFAQEAISKNYQSIKIIPLFLLSGIHVQEDIPRQIDIARQKLPSLITIELRPHLGSHEHLLSILTQKFAPFKAQKKILLAHGSKLKNGNQECEKIATQLNVELAYWSIKPNIQEKIAYFSANGVKSIAIVPYFLFEGRITQAIAGEIEQLKRQYPQLNISASSPLGASCDVAKLVVS
jgi:sirohydrochlorin ferrochelatase